MLFVYYEFTIGVLPSILGSTLVAASSVSRDAPSCPPFQGIVQLYLNVMVVRKKRGKKTMERKLLDHMVGKEFSYAIPQTDQSEYPCYHAQCTITSATEQEIKVHVTVDDWLDERFTLPTPVHVFTLWESMRISVCEIAKAKRVEFLCTL